MRCAGSMVDIRSMTIPVTSHDLEALRRCAHDGSLELHYQPEIDLVTGGIVAMEGLLRWHNAEQGLLSPPAFLDLAEQRGETSAIAEWVLREGAAEAVRWTALSGPPRRLWLNVSAAELAGAGFLELVARVVAEAGLVPGALGLDLAEATICALGPAAETVLTELRAAGVALAVDDFTSWFATLGAISSLPIDAIKLGHRYVRGVGESDGAQASGDVSVATVITEAHKHGMIVIAEGVETWGEAARLTELGCDRAHGWLFASAQRADKARWLLQHGTGWQGSGLVPAPRV